MSSRKKAADAKSDGEVTLVPRLRFPEFRNESAWNLETLGALGDFTRGLTYSARDVTSIGLLVLRSTNIQDGILVLDRELVFVSKACPDALSLRKGDIVVCMSNGSKALVGKNAEYLGDYPGELTVGAFCSFYRPELPFAKIGFQTDRYQRYVADLIAGGNINNLTNTVLESFNFPVPDSPTERQKVAECLSSVDELIAAQARKVDALKTHKKGLMQQLFPREGERQPHLRFSEFREHGEWKKVPLGEIAEIKLGKMLDKQKHMSGHLLPYLNNLAVRWNEVNTSDLPRMYFEERELDRFGLRAGDVVVCEGGEPGRAAVWDGHLPDLKFQKAIHRVRFKVPFEPKILVLHLENLAGTTEFEMLFTGGGIKHLTGETFSRLKIPLIPYAEQQRIAYCMGSLDALITAETQKLDTLKHHKRGLMQQLFPASANATA